MGRLAAIVPIESRRRPLTEEEQLRAELARAQGQVATLTEVARDQAKAIAELCDECPPWAPSLAILYWLWGPTRWHEPQWARIAARLRPVLADIGDVPAPKVTPMLWAAHRARRRVEPSAATGRPVSEAMLNRELERAKELLRWAVENKLIRFNPLTAAKPVKVPSRRETWLPPAAVDRLLEACSKLINRTRQRRSFGKVIASRRAAPSLSIRWWEDGNTRQRTGFKTRGEALEALQEIRAGLSLGHSDDDWKARVMRAYILACHDSMLRPNEARLIRRDRIGADGRVELSSRETKGAKRRTIYLTPRTLAAFNELPIEAGNPYVFAHRPYGKWSLSQKKIGGPIGDRRLEYWFRRLCDLAGVDSLAAPGDVRVHRHDLRASGASTADEMGARATAIRDALGHSTLAVTQIYLRSGQAANARTVAGVLSKLSDTTAGGAR
jgi:site-specific recombinase XerD